MFEAIYVLTGVVITAGFFHLRDLARKANSGEKQ